jgi:hypothetical protein
MLGHAFRERERVGAEPVSDGLKTFSEMIERSSHGDKIHSIIPTPADGPRYFC